MWLDPENFKRWMRPSDADLIYIELHPVLGGIFRFDLQENDGRIFTHTGQYLEIQRPHKLRMTWNSTVLGDFSSKVTVEFYAQEEKCLIVLIHDLPEDGPIFADHQRGWAVILERFIEILAVDKA